MRDDKTVLFDYNDYIDIDELRESDPEYYEGKGDQELWDELSRIEEDDWEQMKQMLEDVIGDNRLICLGTAGTWRGEFQGGFFADDFDDAIRKMRGRTDGYFEVYISEGELNIGFHHHDGSHHLVIRTLTDAGEDYIYTEIDEWEVDTPETHRKVFDDSDLSRPIVPAW